MSSEELSKESNYQAVFKEHFPQGTLSPIALSEIPQQVFSWDWPEVQQSFPQSPDTPYFVVKDTDRRIATYIARQLPRMKNGAQTIYVVDMRDNKAIGVGILIYNDVIKHKGSYVAWTETDPEHQKEGVGSRRSRLLRALSAAWFGVEVESSNIMSPSGKALAASLKRNRDAKNE